MFNPSPVLITGCSTGIGRACAERLAGSGHKVYATARNAESIAGLRERGCETLALDITDEASMSAAVEEIVRREGRIGALVNNAGYSQSGAVETLDLDALRAQFETNVFGLVRLTQLVLPSMREAHAGRIVNMSSMGANFVFPGGGAYHASKYAVEALSDALRFEVAGFGVKVALIQPGAIKTEFDKRAVDSLASHRSDSAYDKFNRTVGKVTQQAYEKGPLKWLGGGPEAVATAVEKALTDERPRVRYLVTPSAYVLTLNRRLLGARGWDLFARTQFPRPG